MAHPKLKAVSRDELSAFVRSYPGKLVHDFGPFGHSWNDFDRAPMWPESVVAWMDEYEDGFKILDEGGEA